MTITREILLAQKTVAIAERERLVAAANMKGGEIKALDQLLDFLDLPDQPPCAHESESPAPPRRRA